MIYCLRKEAIIRGPKKRRKIVITTPWLFKEETVFTKLHHSSLGVLFHKTYLWPLNKTCPNKHVENFQEHLTREEILLFIQHRSSFGKEEPRRIWKTLKQRVEQQLTNYGRNSAYTAGKKTRCCKIPGFIGSDENLKKKKTVQYVCILQRETIGDQGHIQGSEPPLEPLSLFIIIILSFQYLFIF